MDTISSADFRKGYAKLTKLTAVTANGHVIGVWDPSIDGRRAAEDILGGDRLVATQTMVEQAAARLGEAAFRADPDLFKNDPVVEASFYPERFNTQPFRGPIPKKR